LITEIVTAWLDRLSRVGLKVRMTTAPDAYAIQVPIDAIRLTQVFHNLLENAGRYARSGSQLDICVALEERFVRIDVIDYGPGVPEESLPHLFNRFFREDRSRNRATGGSGLGLAISRSIVEAHAGTISATRSPVSGLTISMRLPIISGFQ
jgi:two-component system sensor histidine kinase BaeS